MNDKSKKLPTKMGLGSNKGADIGAILKRKDEYKDRQVTKAKESIMKNIEESERQSGAQTAPMIKQEDIDFIASTKVKLS